MKPIENIIKECINDLPLSTRVLFDCGFLKTEIDNENEPRNGHEIIHAKVYGKKIKFFSKNIDNHPKNHDQRTFRKIIKDIFLHELDHCFGVTKGHSP